MEIADRGNTEVSRSLIDRLCNEFSDGIHFAAPLLSLRTNEVDLVRGILRMMQGYTSSFFYWDNNGQSFHVKSGIYVAHLSKGSLYMVLNQFIYAATCLQLVDNVVSGMESSGKMSSPTLRAFSCSASAWLKKLRVTALKEEMKISESDIRFTPTLLGLASCLSSICSGAEYLLQIVNGAIPHGCLKSDMSSVPAADIAVHVLDYLYKKLDEVCLVHGGEEEIYQMLLHIFVGSVLPYIEGLDTWLFEGTLDDPFEEMFFYANKAILVDEADFWEKSYLLRRLQSRKLDIEPSSLALGSSRAYVTKEKMEMGEKESISLTSSIKGKEHSNSDLQVCPLFIKDIGKSIVSAGKSLQLIRHVPTVFTASSRNGNNWINGLGNSTGDCDLRKIICEQSIAGLTLSDIFCMSLAGLIGHNDHISRYFWQDDSCESEIFPSLVPHKNGQMLGNGNGKTLPPFTCSEKTWYKFLVDTMLKRGVIGHTPAHKVAGDLSDVKEENMTTGFENKTSTQKAFCPENPVITLCETLLEKNTMAQKELNLSRNFHLPAINDMNLRKAALSGESGNLSQEGTNYAFGFQFVKSEYMRSQDDLKLLETMFPFPTLLPSFQDELRMSELLPFQKNSTLQSRVLSWIQGTELRNTPLPIVMMRECLTFYIKKQVDHIGRIILSKLMNDWRLMDELAVLRAVYLLRSGDLLQHFLTVIFNKLDKGETWDDDFELNIILQESIRNSADGMLLTAPDSLVVSITKNHSFEGDEQIGTSTLASTPRKNHVHSSGIDGLDSLKFTYKVPWPLELIANMEAINKYNQVMGFLLKVKRAKFVLDKARKWIWKGKGTVRSSHKRHWLLEQKLLHFVDAFHQYVMDRVYHSAWGELCEGMAAAGSLDEVIEVHEAYLLSIQRQCFVVPDKLWALIASRVNSILGLALDFYSIQQTLSSGGAISTIKARCEMEMDRIEKQFDDCMAFLLRVLSFKLNVGHFPHLADLVTRINYNYFYMSDSGSLMTAPGSETDRSRLGKAAASRAK